ncbi:MAG: hypothetical protein SGARI_000205 [Bacillariaceae sp.]
MTKMPNSSDNNPDLDSDDHIAPNGTTDPTDAGSEAGTVLGEEEQLSTTTKEGNNSNTMAVDDDDDDKTVPGGHTKAPATPRGSNVTTLTTRLVFTAKTKESKAVYADRGKTILAEILRKFDGQVKIMDNNGKNIRRFDSSFTTDQFNRQFQLHTRKKAPQATNNSQTHFYQFNLSTTSTFKEIRTDIDVERYLKSYSVLFETTPWAATIVDTAEPGFVMGFNPSYITAAEAEERIRHQLASHPNVTSKKIPKFHCIQKKVGAKLFNRWKSVSVYAISVQQRHYKTMTNMMSTAYENTPTDYRFVVFKSRHDGTDAFATAVHWHAKFVNDHRVVAVKGINNDEIFSMAPVLQRFPEILDVYRTHSTYNLNSTGQPIGRHNFLCKQDKFLALARALHENLLPAYSTYLTSKGLEFDPDTMEAVTVVSHFPGKPGFDEDDYSDSSLTTRDSYMTQCASVFESCYEVLKSDFDPPRVVETTHTVGTPATPSTISTATTMATPATSRRSYARVARTTNNPPMQTVQTATTASPAPVSIAATMESINALMQQLSHQLAADPSVVPPDALQTFGSNLREMGSQFSAPQTTTAIPASTIQATPTANTADGDPTPSPKKKRRSTHHGAASTDDTEYNGSAQ